VFQNAKSGGGGDGGGGGGVGVRFIEDYVM